MVVYSPCPFGGRGEVIMNKIVYIFPCLMMALDIGAAIVYGINGDFKKVVYWIAAAVLNAAVTF